MVSRDEQFEGNTRGAARAAYENPVFAGGMEYSGPAVEFAPDLARKFSELLHGLAAPSASAAHPLKMETQGEGLEGLRLAAIASLTARIMLLPPEERSALMALLGDLGAATDSKALSTARLTIDGEIDAAFDRTTNQHIDHEAEKRAAKIKAMHDTFYATDAVYRAQTDAITADAKALLDTSDKKQEKLDALAEEYGVTTDVDGDVKRLRQQLAAAKNPDEALRIHAELAQAQVEQNKARGDILEQRGETQGAAKFRKEDKPLEGAFGKAMELLQEQRTVFLQAQERSMAGKSKEEIEAALQESKNMFAEEDKSLLKSRNVEQVNDFKVRLKERPATLEEPTKGVVIPAAVGVELTPATQETSLKFPTATASLAALPPPSPMGGKKSGPGTGAGTGMVIT